MRAVCLSACGGAPLPPGGHKKVSYCSFNSDLFFAQNRAVQGQITAHLIMPNYNSSGNSADLQTEAHSAPLLLKLKNN